MNSSFESHLLSTLFSNYLQAYQKFLEIEGLHHSDSLHYDDLDVDTRQPIMAVHIGPGIFYRLKEQAHKVRKEGNFTDNQRTLSWFVERNLSDAFHRMTVAREYMYQMKKDLEFMEYIQGSLERSHDESLKASLEQLIEDNEKTKTYVGPVLESARKCMEWPRYQMLDLLDGYKDEFPIIRVFDMQGDALKGLYGNEYHDILRRFYNDDEMGVACRLRNAYLEAHRYNDAKETNAQLPEHFRVDLDGYPDF
ncbi:MAG: hypothetical protein ACOC32_00870 [Nanoarchaeota archaeon]